MIRLLSLGLTFSVLLFSPLVSCNADEKDDVRAKQWQALLKHLKDKGIDLREVDSKGSYIQRQFTLGPDHSQDQRVGFNYLPPLTLNEAQDKYMEYSLPHRFHGDWAIFEVGSRGGDDYEA